MPMVITIREQGNDNEQEGHGCQNNAVEHKLTPHYRLPHENAGLLGGQDIVTLKVPMQPHSDPKTIPMQILFCNGTHR